MLYERNDAPTGYIRLFNTILPVMPVLLGGEAMSSGDYVGCPLAGAVVRSGWMRRGESRVLWGLIILLANGDVGCDPSGVPPNLNYVGAGRVRKARTRHAGRNLKMWCLGRICWLCEDRGPWWGRGIGSRSGYYGEVWW